MRKGLRIALVALGLNCISFFHGCENQSTQMSFGFPAPVVTVQYGDTAVQTPVGQTDVSVPTKIVSWSAWAPLANVWFLMAGAVLVWRRGGISAAPWWCFWLAATILNCLHVPLGGWVWMYVVFVPTGWLVELVEELLMWGLAKPHLGASDETGLSTDIASRLYFVMLFAASWGLAAAGGWVYRRFKQRE
jgi:hypothetical protein